MSCYRLRLAFIAALGCTVIGLVGVPGAGAGALLYKAEPGPYGITVVDREWRDGIRDRVVPARLYLPESSAAERFPVVVFSHGLWAGRQNYRYFARHLASHGYVVILPQHSGSDTGALFCLTCDLALVTDWILDNPTAGGPMSEGDRKLLQSSIADPANLVNRPLDVSFVIDQLSKDPALTASADSSRVGVAGHSFGAYTSMAVAGMLVDLPPEHGGADRSFRDPRVTASLAMSPQGPGTMGISDGAWSGFAVPGMFLTGSADYGTGEAAEQWRRTAFDQIAGLERYLVTLKHAGHGAFAGRAELTDAVEGSTGLLGTIESLLDPAALEATSPVATLYNADVIKSVSTAFLDSYLKGDSAATAWLSGYVGDQPDAVAEFRSE